MKFDFKTKVQQEIWQLIQDLNDIWVKGRPEDLLDLFHEDMVIISPDFQERGRGKEACMKSYKDFSTQADIKDLKVMNPRIDVYENTAITSYSFEITYEMKDKIFHDTGRDMLVFVREGGKWQAVWRTILPLSPDK
jgi:hypothetical protein